MDSSRRRRAAAFVTKNACTECRRQRSKCDGQQPCAHCLSQGNLVCEYKVPAHISKESMRIEIDQLREYRRSTEHVLGSLTANDRHELVIRQLKDKVPVEEISRNLSSMDALASPSASGSTYEKSKNDMEDHAEEILERVEGIGIESEEDATDDLVEDFRSERQWTEVTQDRELMEHLLQLYFCWEYPIFTSLSKAHFLEDYYTGRSTYCSSLLVNAIFAIGCKFSERQEVRVKSDQQKATGEQFYNEAKRLLASQSSIRPLTSIQAIGLLSIWEASNGRHEMARFYSGQAMRMAIEEGLYKQINNDAVGNSELEREVQLATFWGAFALDLAWSQIAGSTPQLSYAGFHIRKPLFTQVEEEQWIPYIDTDMPQSSDLRQLSNIGLVSRGFCGLSVIVFNSSHAIHRGLNTPTDRSVVEQYTRYLTWYNDLPSSLRLGDNSTPPVFFTHMYYHFSLLNLFYPHADLSFLHSNVSPREICADAANAISILTQSFKKIHTLRRTPCILAYIILASGIVTMLIGGDLKNTHYFDQLREMEAAHSGARAAGNLLQSLQEWGPSITIEERKKQLVQELDDLLSPSIASMMFARMSQQGQNPGDGFSRTGTL